MALTGWLIHVADRTGRVVLLFPKQWAESHAALHLSVGPYYVSAIVVLLAVLGIVGIVLKLTGRMPAPPRMPRRHQVSCCPNCVYLGDGSECGWYCGSCCDGCCQGCIVSDCPALGASSCDACGSAAAGCGEGAVLLVILCIFAIIGVVIGIFFATVVSQRIMMRHVHLLQMRSETQRVVVVDLAETPNLLHDDGPIVAPLSLRRHAVDAELLPV